MMKTKVRYIQIEKGPERLTEMGMSGTVLWVILWAAVLAAMEMAGT